MNTPDPGARRRQLLTLIPGLVLAALALIGVWLTRPEPPAPAAPVGPALPATTTEAEVVAILEEGTVEMGTQQQAYQILRVRLVDGPWAGQEVEVDYGRQQLRPSNVRLTPGERILVITGQRPDGVLTAYFMDYTRGTPLLVLAATFLVFIVAVSGWKGVRGLLGMAFSLAVIVGYILPRILRGDDPVTVSVTGAFLLLAVTLYLVYGWTLKTHAAVLGTLLALVLTGVLAGLFVELSRLTGYGNEEALFLVQQVQGTINLRGIVLGGMLIGALGVLDDLTISQASAVFELHQANPGLDLRSLYRRGMRIGQDHVAATINTLVLAYTGAALPLLLLFTLSGESFGHLANLEFVTEEIVRTLVGSLGLMAAVPITTGIACLVARHHGRLGALRPLLGPETTAESGHVH